MVFGAVEGGFDLRAGAAGAGEEDQFGLADGEIFGDAGEVNFGKVIFGEGEFFVQLAANGGERVVVGWIERAGEGVDAVGILCDGGVAAAED